ncbi:MAG: histidinol-phosphatase [Actinobacteria bacterium]|nr:histidinol-phosphatase [Actinomycetota bacterium]
MDSDLAFALHLADMADAMTLTRFRAADLRVETKLDLTPVTEVDRAVEAALRDRISSERPGEAVVGEEFGEQGGGACRWILDPIDGTKNFVRGIPVFATLIALEREGEIVTGVASAPALGRRWWAARGGGAFADGRAIRVSTTETLEDAMLCYTGALGFERVGLGEQFLALARRCWRNRGFGDFWQHVLVAEGSADVAVEPQVSLWDLAALKVIVEEAGGRFTDLSGAPTPSGGSAVSTNGRLHEDVLATVGTAPPEEVATVALEP